MNAEPISPRDHARISVAAYRARRLEATQRIIVIQRCGNAIHAPTCSTSRLMAIASRQPDEPPRRPSLWSRLRAIVGEWRRRL